MNPEALLIGVSIVVGCVLLAGVAIVLATMLINRAHRGTVVIEQYRDGGCWYVHDAYLDVDGIIFRREIRFEQIAKPYEEQE